ncbi:GNAT family N-acetyltransferase [Cryptosporangium sp. NPDC048952]|uniref:GNAT family N-acetyltransferase n=1 Tax=Cryptosporangium sp. NPDC048952 TaxID=3363961 RepID=UPI003722B538
MKRLRLEPVGRPEHVDELLALHRDPAVAEWFGEWTREQISSEVARMTAGWRVDGAHKWMAYDRVTGAVVGRGGLSRKFVDGRDRWEIGWVLHHRYWGQGYAHSGR